jgi:hypothetical protein
MILLHEKNDISWADSAKFAEKGQERLVDGTANGTGTFAGDRFSQFFS